MKNYNSDIAYEYIRKRIIGEECAPRLPLMTEALATAIGISRTPVREALRKLEADGLVSIRPRLGACVKRMDMKEFYEICEVRIALEGHAAGLASKNRTDAELEEIQYALNAAIKRRTIAAGWPRRIWCLEARLPWQRPGGRLHPSFVVDRSSHPSSYPYISTDLCQIGPLGQ